MSDSLTRKQESALLALARPNSGHASQFWHDAKASWPGPRKTLGSLIHRGLADYDNGWKITEAGEKLADEIEAERHES